MATGGRFFLTHRAGDVSMSLWVTSRCAINCLCATDCESHPVTIPLAELFLSKTQIVELNRKDALDIISLLLDNEVGLTDDTINMNRITRLCLKDWGLYKTLTINLSKVETVLVNENPGLSDEDTQRVLERINTIRRILDRSAKSILWKMRDRLGTRLRWYTEVEEVAR